MPLSNRSSALARIPQALALICTATMLQACATSGVSLTAPGQPPQQLSAGSPLLPIGNPIYHVSPMDVLQVEVYPANERNVRIDYGSQIHIEAAFAGQSYFISPGDTLSVEINSDSDVVQQILVRPDGYITLPHLSKDIRAAGRAPMDLGQAISAQYAAIMKAPQVTITVTNSAIEQLAKVGGTYQVGLDGNIVVPGLGSFTAVGETTASLAGHIGATARAWYRDPVRISASIGQLTGRDLDPRIEADGRTYFRGPAKVSPDGKLYLQPGGYLDVAGKTLEEVHNAATNLLQPKYANPIDVNVGLIESPSLAVFIGGEVRQPGRYAYAKSMTMLQAITIAGWLTDVGDLDRVLLLHPASPSHYLVYQSNLQEVLDRAAVDQDLAVGPQDLVVIPMTGIGTLDKVVDQYIRKVIPFNTSATYSYISNPVGNTITRTVQ